MTGTDRVRFCSSCQLNVYNVAAMTGDEVRALITKSEGRICGRLYRRTDGTVITRDCPVGFRAVQRRVRRMAGGGFATLLSLASVAIGQSAQRETQSDRQAQVVFERSKNNQQIGEFSGVVVDATAASIPGAEITVINQTENSERKATTNEKGAFVFP